MYTSLELDRTAAPSPDKKAKYFVRLRQSSSRVACRYCESASEPLTQGSEPAKWLPVAHTAGSFKPIVPYLARRALEARQARQLGQGTEHARAAILCISTYMCTYAHTYTNTYVCMHEVRICTVIKGRGQKEFLHAWMRPLTPAPATRFYIPYFVLGSKSRCLLERAETTWLGSGLRGRARVQTRRQHGVQLYETVHWQLRLLFVGGYVYILQQSTSPCATTTYSAGPVASLSCIRST